MLIENDSVCFVWRGGGGGGGGEEEEERKVEREGQKERERGR